MNEEYQNYYTYSNVGYVDFINESVDRLFECFPGQPLESHAALIRNVLLHHTELRGWDVSPYICRTTY